MRFVVKATKPIPTKNKKVIDEDKRSMVIGSVDGVKIAPATAEAITTNLHADNIFFQEIIPKKPKINCRIGNWKAKPVESINSSTKSKYFSIDHSGSTTSAP